MRDLGKRVGRLEATAPERHTAPTIVIECGPDTVERPRPWDGRGPAYIRVGDPIPGRATDRAVIVLPGKARLPDGDGGEGDADGA